MARACRIRPSSTAAAGAEFQAEELTRVEQFPIPSIPPTMQPVGFVAGRDRLLRDVPGPDRVPSLRCGCVTGKVLLVRLLEEPAAMLRLPVRVVVLDCEQAMTWRAGLRPRVARGLTAATAHAALPASRTGDGELPGAGSATSRTISVGHFREFAAVGAQHHVLGVSCVAGDQIAGEQIDVGSTILAVDRLDPQEVLHWNVGIAVERAVGDVRVADLDRELLDESVSGASIGDDVQVVDLFADHPRRHRIDVEAQHVTADPVRFEQRRAAAHEWIRDGPPGEIVGGKEALGEGLVTELGERQTAKQRARPPGEPLVNGDDRTVVLLDLLLPSGHCRDERDVEAGLDGHGVSATIP